MKKIHKRILGIAVILLVLFTYSYFHVTGNEINGASNISSVCSITITKSYHLVESEQKYVLDANQIELLKTLILESNFTRDLSTWVQFFDKDKYLIKIDFNNSQDFLIIHCIGNEYISISNQFNGKHLKINNPNWKSTLEEIIALSK